METLTLVLTDVEGSTRRWAGEPDAMDAAMRRHHEIVHAAVAAHGGVRPPDQGEGDAVFAAFTTPAAALAAVTRLQRDLHAETWPTAAPLRVRVGVHVGEVRIRDGNLFGDPVNRCARIRGLASGGQTLVSAAVYELVRDHLPAGATLRDLGEHRMKDLTRAEHVHQLDLVGIAGDFPPLASLDRVRHNLPVQATPFIGRERDLVRTVAMLREHRSVTVTGAGGMGKTRLALQAAAELAAAGAGDTVGFDQVWFVDLSSEDDPGVVAARAAEAAGVTYDDDPAAALAAALADTRTLLVLDNLEQILGCAAFVSDLLRHTTRTAVLATSREALRIQAEHVLPLDPMVLPAPDGGGAGLDPETLSTYDAVRFFVERARAVKPDFAVTTANAPAVAAVCARLDGHPLALELAAARLRMLSVDALLTRLDTALTILTGGSRDMPQRHQTLRATIAWSYDTLDDDARTLLARMSTMPAPATFEFVEAVYGEGLDVFGVLESLLDRSMIRTYEPDDASGDTRYGLLVSVRDYAAEHLDRADADDLRDRHARHVTALLSAVDNSEHNELLALVARLLPHVRAALAHTRTTPDQRYVDLVVAVGDNLVVLGHPAESAADLRTALPVATRPRDRTEILLAIGLTVPGQERTELERAAMATAVESGHPPTIGFAAARIVSGRASEAEVTTALSAYDGIRDRLTTPQRVDLGISMANSMAMRFRYSDPDRVERLVRTELAANPHEALLMVRLARVLLDLGRVDEAGGVLAPAAASSAVHAHPLWERLAQAERGRLALALDDLAVARDLVEPAFDTFVEFGSFPLQPGQYLTDLHRATGDPAAVAATVDRALAVSDELGSATGETLRWRRGRALLALGRPDAARDDLTAARDVLAASPEQGPLELLGCLAALALLACDEDPREARRLLDVVAAGRGGWVLPHLADRDVATVSDWLARHG